MKNTDLVGCVFLERFLKGLTHSVGEHSAENMIFGRIWGGRPGIETENASNWSSLMIEMYETPF